MQLLSGYGPDSNSSMEPGGARHMYSFTVLWRNTVLSVYPGIRYVCHQSFSASTQPSQTRHDRPKRTDFRVRPAGRVLHVVDIGQ